MHDLNNQPAEAQQPEPEEVKRPDIALFPVESNQVKAIGYDSATETLAMQFKHGAGAIYHYPGVTKELHEALMAAESIGKFFGQHIKPLPFTKYAPEPVAETAQAEEAA